MVFEIVCGLLTGSLALISDALHNVTDVSSMALSLWAEKMSAKPSTEHRTYGYKKIEAIVAFVNGIVLTTVVIFIAIEAIKKLFRPEAVSGWQMALVALIALIGNGIATYLLQKDAHKNINLKSAWLHSFQDAAFSLIIVIGALIVQFTNIFWIDPALSLLVAIFLFKEIYELVVEAIDMLLDSVPKNIDLNQVREVIKAFPEIMAIDDLHIWQLGSECCCLSAHLETKSLDEQERLELLANLQKIFKEKFNIDHSTLQIGNTGAGIKLNCQHCN